MSHSPSIPGLQMPKDGCAYAFIIKHGNDNAKTGTDTLIFDLGVRKDFENGPTAVVEQSKSFGMSFIVEKDVATTLEENGQDLNDVDAIVWSHYHIVSFIDIFLV
jgi:hypothetical protein